MSKAAETIAKLIIAKIEAVGILPWQRPWTPIVPANYNSRRAYTGFNRFWLQWVAAAAGYTSSYWLTPNQAIKLGGSFKGEKTTLVVYWMVRYNGRGDGRDMTDAEKAAYRAAGKMYMAPIYHNLLNLDQVQGIERPENITTAPRGTMHDILDGMVNGPAYNEGQGERCYYVPAADSIHMCAAAQFESENAYWQTRAHEYIHATGHASRLNRDGVTNTAAFGSHAYGKEELVAEFGAAMLMGEAGLTPCIDNSAAYLSNWLDKIKENPMALVSAANAASKAVEYILGHTTAGDEPEDAE